jgi:3-dehydrotetronate 4-kinase
MAIIFGAVADDDTGATDLAGMLAGQGLRSILAIDLPSRELLAEWAADCDAVILGVGSRAASPAVAYARMREGVRLLDGLHPRVLQIKYCSTFDSTAEGNIGQSIDAAMDELGESFTVALPALPVNGRTTYMGYHFVHQRLLSDSPMRHHPLTPMTDPDLVAHLQSQTRRKVGLAPHSIVSQGAERLRDHLNALRKSGESIAVIDCTSDADLSIIGQAILDLRLITGSSAPAMVLPSAWKREGWWEPAAGASLLPARRSRGRGFLIVAGSCSQATLRQNESLVASGVRAIQLDAVDLASNECLESAIICEAAGELAQGLPCLLRTATTPEDVDRVHQWARATGHTQTEAGCRIAERLATIAREIIQRSAPEGLIIAGGETSGALCRTLRMGALRVGANIEPGVPLCVSLGIPSLPVVLKSGNFGSVNFYEKAIAAIQSYDS